MVDSTTTEHRRLAVLKHLESSSEFTSNASILNDVVNGVGVPTSEDQMRACLSWLTEQELIEMTDHGHVVVATATVRGAEVARGRATHPGVKRPSARR
jgi:ribosomal protein L12E/L44/L45/RPP1/RPP2